MLASIYTCLGPNLDEQHIAITRQAGETYERLITPIGELGAKREAFELSNYQSVPDLTAHHLNGAVIGAYFA